MSHALTNQEFDNEIVEMVARWESTEILPKDIATLVRLGVLPAREVGGVKS